MTRRINRLTALAVIRVKTKCMLADGAGLYLQTTLGIDGTVRKSWLFRYTAGDRERWAGLGSFTDVTLGQAREKAVEYRRLRADGIDPLAQREARKAAAALEAVRAMTFSQCSDGYIAAHKSGWRNAKHRQQWVNTLETYAKPVFGSLPVASIDTGLVLKVVEPIWATKPETASRIRQRIESVLDWARVRGYRQGENPARWRGHLDELLPARSKMGRVKHHVALSYQDIGAFMAALRELPAIAARALEFTILCAARTGETLGARWPEIDLAQQVWTVPPDRMKAGREHRVPLSNAVVDVLERMAELREADDGHVFPGELRAALLDKSMVMLLRRMGHAEITTHGFRSSFRDWAAERTSYPSEVVEMALAHAVADKTEAAYRRGDLFGKRRRLMDGWAQFCAKPAATATVVTLRPQAQADSA